jgi:hypothetical protein
VENLLFCLDGGSCLRKLCLGLFGIIIYPAIEFDKLISLQFVGDSLYNGGLLYISIQNHQLYNRSAQREIETEYTHISLCKVLRNSSLNISPT